MKKILLFIALFLPVFTVAAEKEKLEYKLRLGGGFVSAIPLGQFAHSTNPFLLTGQTNTSLGLYIDFDFPVYKNWRIGFQFNEVEFGINENVINQQVVNHFSAPNFYTNLTSSAYNYYLDVLNTTVSYLYRTKYIEVEPYAYLGFASLVIRNGMTLKHKKVNDNYYENIYLTTDSKPASFYFPSLGVRVNKKVYKRIMATVGLQYTFGSVDYQMISETIDINEHESLTKIPFHQDISIFQIHGGIKIGLHEPGYSKRLENAKKRD